MHRSTYVAALIHPLSTQGPFGFLPSPFFLYLGLDNQQSHTVRQSDSFIYTITHCPTHFLTRDILPKLSAFAITHARFRGSKYI